MKVFIIGPTWDTGGQAARIKQAFERYTDWTVRTMHRSVLFFKYPSDLPWDLELAKKVYDDSDVIHHRNGILLYQQLDQGKHKPAVVHHHGSALRAHPYKSSEASAIGAVQLVSTVDLLDDAPMAEWLPAPYDLDAIRNKYRRSRRDNTIRIGHAPTNWKAKGTDEILHALDKICMRHRNVEVDLIENVEWRACLSRKGLCDILIDQLTLGFGNNAVEAMAMGIPVVSGWQDSGDRVRFLEATGERPPFLEANAKNLVDQLELLVLNRELREEWGALGRAYAERFHSEESIVVRLKAVYRRAQPTKDPHEQKSGEVQMSVQRLEMAG